MFSVQALQIGLVFRVVNKGFLITLLIFGIVISVATIVAVQSTFATAMGGNKTNGGTFANMTFLGNMMPRKNMTMPGGNMTFGASLQNAKMHVTEAIMDLNSGNTKGAAMEMNLTAQSIRLHEQELKVMMMEIKNMMTAMKAGSHIITSKNPAPNLEK